MIYPRRLVGVLVNGPVDIALTDSETVVAIVLVLVVIEVGCAIEIATVAAAVVIVPLVAVVTDATAGAKGV